MLAAGGCTVTSHATHCENGTCTVNLNGSGSSSELGSTGSTVTLVTAEDGVATIELDGAQGSCSAGETIELAAKSVACTEVGDNSVKLVVE